MVVKGGNAILKHCCLYESNATENKCKLFLLPKELLSLTKSTITIQIVVI